MGRPTKFSPEVKERAVRLVREQRRDYGSQNEAIRSVAEKIGCHAETLRGWLRRTEVDEGVRPGITTDDHARITALEREVKELRRANEILKKAAAYFAQAELDRRGT